MNAPLRPRRERFRALLNGDACISPASVHDPISARVAESIGFEAGILAGSVASLAVLGAPDLILLTLTEFAEQARRICRASDLPLFCDADHGYGNALNVMRTVVELEDAGVAALMIEDTLLPAAFGQGAKPRIVDVGEGVGRMRAALAARRDPSLVIVGRTSAATISGVDDAIARCRRYADTGVDAIFVTGFARYADVEALSRAVQVPLMLGTLPPSLADRARLAALRVRIALQGHAPYFAAIEATRRTLQALRNGAVPGDIEGVASARSIGALSREDEWRRFAASFLGARDSGPDSK